MSAVTTVCAGHYKGCSHITPACGRGGGGGGVTVMLGAGQPKSAPWHHLAEHGSDRRQVPGGAPATSPSSSSRYQSAWQSPLPQMGLTFCSISFDTSSAVDSRETCQLLRSIPYLPKGLCSLARNVISLVRVGDFSRRYLGGGNRSPHPISFPFPSPAKAPCLFWLDVEVTQSSLSVLAKLICAYALGRWCCSYTKTLCVWCRTQM